MHQGREKECGKDDGAMTGDLASPTSASAPSAKPSSVAPTPIPSSSPFAAPASSGGAVAASVPIPVPGSIPPPGSLPLPDPASAPAVGIFRRAWHAHPKVTVFNLFWVFIVVSVVGLYGETVVSYFVDGEWKSRAGLLWGPFSPIYGLGALLMTLLLNGIARHGGAVTFVAAAILGGAFEFAVGMFWQQAFGIVSWSYINEPFNLNGHTSLRAALMWGALGLVWIKLLYPWFAEGLDRLRGRLPKATRVVTAVMAVFLAVNVLMTFVTINCWFERQVGWPVETAVQQFCAEHFDDEFMAGHFGTMGMYVDQAVLR